MSRRDAVLDRWAKGETAPVIALATGLSIETVRCHVKQGRLRGDPRAVSRYAVEPAALRQRPDGATALRVEPLTDDEVLREDHAQGNAIELFRHMCEQHLADLRKHARPPVDDAPGMARFHILVALRAARVPLTHSPMSGPQRETCS